MEKTILQNVSICLSCAVLFRDAFSGEPVTGGIQVRVLCKNAKKPVKKPGGYWLFLDVGQKEFEAEITSPIYQTRRILLRADGREEAEEIFLYPSSSYPVKAGSTMVTGTVKPGIQLYFHLEEEELACRLFQDCKKGEEQLSIFMKGEADRQCRNWYIWNREQKSGEYVQIQGLTEDSEQSRLRVPLQIGYRRKNTALYPAYECTADEEGSFFLILGRLRERTYTMHYQYMDGKKKISGECEIQGTRQNEIMNR